MPVTERTEAAAPEYPGFSDDEIRQILVEIYYYQVRDERRGWFSLAMHPYLGRRGVRDQWHLLCSKEGLRRARLDAAWPGDPGDGDDDE